MTAAVSAPTQPGRLYLVGRRGVVRIFEGGRVSPQPFLDLSGQVGTQGEMGLLSIVFDPSFGSNNYVFAFYNDTDRRLTISRFTVSGNAADKDSELVLLRVDHPDSPYHNGGQLAFGPDGQLYAGTGDGGYLAVDKPPLQPDPHGNSQNLDALLGKILRIDPTGVNKTPQVVAYGLRNPWRFSFFPGGAIVIGDVGWNSYEELDIIPAGSGLLNFGWSTYEGRIMRRGGPPLNPDGQLTFPAYAYATRVGGNCGIIAGRVYRGRVASLRGRFVFGDYCSGRVWSSVVSGTRITQVKLLPLRIPHLTSFGETSTGELVAVTDNGRLVRFSP